MIYPGKQMEEKALLDTAARMCVAARTAPKSRGIDEVLSLVLTGEDKDRLADQVDEIGRRDFGEEASVWYGRDAQNVRDAGAVVLLGMEKTYRGVARCSFCGFEDCNACKEAGGHCAFLYTDLGIALSSAVMVAAQDQVDNRIMWSVGKAAAELKLGKEDIFWIGIPLSVAGKNIFFDRQVKR
mgnify:CR=1 FL=1